MAYVGGKEFDIGKGSHTVQTLDVESDGMIRLMIHNLSGNSADRLDFNCAPDPRSLISLSRALLEASFAVAHQAARLVQAAKSPEQVADETAEILAEAAAKACAEVGDNG